MSPRRAAAKPPAAKPRRRAAAPRPAGAARPDAPVPRLPRKAKGPTPRFHDEAGVDALFGIVSALTAELSVAFERIRTLEQVLESQGVLRPGQLESHPLDPPELQARLTAQEALLDRVFQVLERYGPGG